MTSTQRTQYYTATSLDGYIADENHSLDWLFQFGDGPGEGYTRFIEKVGALAMGSSCYEWMRRYLATAPEGQNAWPYTQPTWVFSHRERTPFPGASLHFVQGDVRPVHAAMCEAAQGLNLWIVGGGDLVGQFLDAGLMDDLFFQVAPVTLGKGAPLLPRRVVKPPLNLVSAAPLAGVFVDLHYEVVRESS